MPFELLETPVSRCPSCAWVYLVDAHDRKLGSINGSEFSAEDREVLGAEIVRALNNHEAVVTALRDLAGIAEGLNDINAGQYAHKSAGLREALEAARRALEAATPPPTAADAGAEATHAA